MYTYPARCWRKKRRLHPPLDPQLRLCELHLGEGRDRAGALNRIYTMKKSPFTLPAASFSNARCGLMPPEPAHHSPRHVSHEATELRGLYGGINVSLSDHLSLVRAVLPLARSSGSFSLVESMCSLSVLWQRHTDAHSHTHTQPAQHQGMTPAP